MKTYKFEIVLTENDLSGDEFYEDAVAKDGTGISDVTEALIQIIHDSNLLHVTSKEELKNILKLTSYTDFKND